MASQKRKGLKHPIPNCPKTHELEYIKKLEEMVKAIQNVASFGILFCKLPL